MIEHHWWIWTKSNYCGRQERWGSSLGVEGAIDTDQSIIQRRKLLDTFEV